MKTHKLGTQGLTGSALGFGCMGLSGIYGRGVDEAHGLEVIRRAYDLGVTFFDTAEAYGPFANERLLGKALKEVRDKVVIATKFGMIFTPEGKRVPGLDSSPKRIREVCDASLQRLGVEVIDLLYQHRVDPHTPIEDVAGAVGDLVKAGKVRYFGLSEAGPETIRRAHATFPVSALQNEYSLWTRDVETGALPLCRELGIGLVPYSPLGRGFLAGAVKSVDDLPERDFRRNNPRFQPQALSRNLGLIETLSRLAAEKGRTPGQLALAWLLHQGGDIVPIPGTTKLHRLEENVAAAEIELSPDELAEISRAVPENAVEGERYEPASMATVGI
jgi:aryl-alcohol dehydrogenase-like predicted oxidoreductase